MVVDAVSVEADGVEDVPVHALLELVEDLVDLVVQVLTGLQLQKQPFSLWRGRKGEAEGRTRLQSSQTKKAPMVASSWLSWMSMLMTCTELPSSESRPAKSSTTWGSPSVPSLAALGQVREEGPGHRRAPRGR